MSYFEYGDKRLSFFGLSIVFLEFDLCVDCPYIVTPVFGMVYDFIMI